ncbi:TIGR00159 family protein [Geovibrio thiophilus]|uniref:Diadenylate cyclase n=1 Tax=Geovibrio thiophilus TaxID=139438 RepID=A0A3R5UYP1_9BACT|nr:diadenylate cyclase CdaA [Geovibrio thiophilus]QAR33038.1 TIGR00159 family protein [Geovibrio thiophilus]
MPEFLKFVTLIDLLDMTIIAVVVYRILLLIKGTRAIQMILGVLLLIVIAFASKYLGLKTTSWVLSNFTGYLFIILVVLFQPEIRRALAVFGETRMLGSGGKSTLKVLDEIVKAASILANRQIGALIVIEGNTDLEHYLETGETLKSLVTKDILISIFIPYSPLHDGAVIIKDGEILKAGCILPLSKKVDIGKNYGTRHRAAIGITEETDAVSVTVSEEKGSITVAHKGVLSEELDAEMLRIRLKELFEIDKRGAKKK